MISHHHGFGARLFLGSSHIIRRSLEASPYGKLELEPARDDDMTCTLLGSQKACSQNMPGKQESKNREPTSRVQFFLLHRNELVQSSAATTAHEQRRIDSESLSDRVFDCRRQLNNERQLKDCISSETHHKISDKFVNMCQTGQYTCRKSPHFPAKRSCFAGIYESPPLVQSLYRIGVG